MCSKSLWERSKKEAIWKPSLPTPWSGLQPPQLWEIHLCCLSLLVCDILTGSPTRLIPMSSYKDVYFSLVHISKTNKGYTSIGKYLKIVWYIHITKYHVDLTRNHFLYIHTGIMVRDQQSIFEWENIEVLIIWSGLSF